MLRLRLEEEVNMEVSEVEKRK